VSHPFSATVNAGPAAGDFPERSILPWIRNQNEEQISRLSAADLAEIDAVLSPHRDLMESLGYSFHLIPL